MGCYPLSSRLWEKNIQRRLLRPEISTVLAKAAPPFPFPSFQSEPQARLGFYPTACQPTAPRGRGKASNVADLETWSLCRAQGITQTPGLAITPIAEACVGQGALVNHHCDPQTSKWAPEVAPECEQVPSLVPEQGLFSPKDLHCGCWILGQIGETASVSNETCTYLEKESRSQRSWNCQRTNCITCFNFLPIKFKWEDMIGHKIRQYDEYTW